MIEYKFSKGSSFPKGVTADIAGQTIQNLVHKYGEARPENLVEEARVETHPLHECFEWDDSEAAVQYRLQQARHVIRSVVIVREERPEQTVRAFVNVDRAGGWKPLDVVLSEPDSRELLLQQALSDLKAFERKYAALSELSGVRAAIVDFMKSVEATEPKPEKKRVRKERAVATAA